MNDCSQLRTGSWAVVDPGFWSLMAKNVVVVMYSCIGN